MEGSDQVFGVFFSDVFYAEVVNYQRERDWV
jgi:hypothetical protein